MVVLVKLIINMEKTPRVFLASIAIAGALAGCKPGKVNNGDQITATNQTTCMQCPDNNISRLDRTLSCGSFQMYKGEVDSGTIVTVTENENGVYKDGKFLRVVAPEVSSINPNNGEKVVIDQETICWVDGSDFEK